MDKTGYLQKILVDQLNYRIKGESIDRIRICISGMEPKFLWEAPSTRITSIGNSILHVIGNADQWLSSIIKGEEVRRDRATEFRKDRKYDDQGLKDLIAAFELRLESYVFELHKTDLTSNLLIQGIETNGVDALVHVIEHFSYHTGQITLLAKYYGLENTNYYGHLDLDED